MREYTESRQHEFWSGVFFILLMTFGLLVTPLLLGQDAKSLKNINGTTVERFPYPIFQQQFYGIPVGQYLVIGPDGYVAGAAGGSPGGALTSFQGRLTPTATLTAADIAGVFAASPQNLTCSDANGGDDSGIVYQSAAGLGRGYIVCTNTLTISTDGNSIHGYAVGPGLTFALDSATGNFMTSGYVHANGFDAQSHRVTSMANGISSDDAVAMNQIAGFAPVASPHTTGVHKSDGGFDANSQKVIHVANGSASDDAVAFGQLSVYALASSVGQKITGTLSPISIASGIIGIAPCIEGTGHTQGTVPDPGGTLGTLKFLREDCTWAPANAFTASNVTAASTIAPTTPVIFLTGSTTIHTITPPTGCTTSGTDCVLWIIMDPSSGAATLASDANIATGYTLNVSSSLKLIYHPATSFWYPDAPPGTGGGGAPSFGTNALGFTTPAASTTRYYGISGAANSSSEASTQIAVPAATTVKNFYVFFGSSATQPATGSLTFNIRKNGNPTSLLITIAARAASGSGASDTTHSVTFAAGDLIDLQIINNASTATVSFDSFSFQYQ